jgi:hypothetical protein
VPTFAEILRMKPEEREPLGRKVITVRWWEESEVRALTRQRWFDKVRADLNEAGKVTLNLGVLKYEQGGSGHDLSEAEQASEDRDEPFPKDTDYF